MTDFTVNVQQPPVYTLVVSGRQGLAGPPGVPERYVHPQPTPSEEWIVNHNFERYPAAVMVLSVGGREMFAEVRHISVNQVRVYFDSPTVGSVICS